MKYTIIAIATILMAGCNNNGRKRGTVKQPESAGKWAIRDSSLFTKKFLNGLSEINDSNTKVTLADTVVIANGDTIHFPSYMKLKQ